MADTPVSTAALRLLLGLTRRQTEVALLLTRGLSPLEIAKELKVDHETVRSHIKELRAKTNTRRESELVQVLLSAGLVAVEGDKMLIVTEAGELRTVMAPT